MTAQTTAPAFGWRVFGIGVIAVAVVVFALRDVDPAGQASRASPGHTLLACATAGVLLIAGAALEWRRTVAWAAGAITAYYAVVIVGFKDGGLILRHAGEFMAYSNTAEQLAVLAAALIVFATYARIDPALAARLTRAGQLAFGVCAILFGGAHFFYMGMTAPLVPAWLPPSQLFWGYATGVFHIAAGVAILTGVKDRLAAVLLTIMYAAFTPLVHLPMLWADPASHRNWTENVTNLILTGAAWVVADSLARVGRGRVSLGR
ncbi:hypothetical protein [Phenylobacterium sp.]|jgi:uncharacterized membrane protein YphA (DoxX/SURF4 family)|uniref:hypothetical protein n=1 Tax=Phenylobacterium sp. TaxID=1871053 RepID=UPI002E339C59|nr:hypothetical protein [Phenylobacterium sp.]HEX3363506.1 hypothetical protein [Phenylobacterium sp.]